MVTTGKFGHTDNGLGLVPNHTCIKLGIDWNHYLYGKLCDFAAEYGIMQSEYGILQREYGILRREYGILQH